MEILVSVAEAMTVSLLAVTVILVNEAAAAKGSQSELLSFHYKKPFAKHCDTLKASTR